MSELGEMARHYNEIRERLRSPPNAVFDRGINLHPNRIPPEPKIVINSPPVQEYPFCKVTIASIPKLPTLPIEPRIVKLSSISKAVCHHYQTTMAVIKGTRRMPRLTLPRHIIYYLAWGHTGMSMPRIAKRLNRKDHTSILHGRNKIREMLLVDEVLRSTIKLIEYEVFAGYYDTDENVLGPTYQKSGDGNGTNI